MRKDQPRIAPLSTRLKTAVQEVTGEQITGAENSAIKSDFKEIPYAGIKTVYSDTSVRRDYFRAAQMAGAHSGMSGGTTVTSPGFYSPFTTPSSFQVPNNRKECYLWAQWWYDNEPKVAAGIDFYRDFPVSSYELECSNSYVKDYYEKLCKRLNLDKWFPQIAHEYYLRGDVFIMASLDCPTCHGDGEWRDEDGDPCEHEGATWNCLDVLDPNMIDVIPGFFGKDANYFFVPSDDMIKVVNEQRPKEQFNAIPPSVRAACTTRTPIKLNPISVWHLKHGASAFSPFGTSLLRRLFTTLAYKDKIRQAQWLIAERIIIPIKLVKVGNKDRPASDDDIQAVEDKLAQLATEPLLTLVTHDAFDFEYIGSNGKVLQLTSEYTLLNEDIIDGLGLNKAIINGDGPTAAGANVGLMAMGQRLEGFRRQLAYWIEERIFKPIAQWNGFTSEGKRGQEELIYPTIKWNDLQLRDDTGKLQTMAALQTNGVISAQTMIEALDIPYDQEVERLRYENAAGTTNNPSTANDANSSALSGLGNGFRGPVGMPGGGGQMGGGIPDLGGGGLPPAGGGAAPPGALPVSASVDNPEDAYRYAVNNVNTLYREVTSSFEQELTVRLASKRIISAAHRDYLASQKPPTGRGLLGPLPEDMTVFPIEPGPLCGGSSAVPLNRMAYNEWTAVYGAVEPPSVDLNTTLEQMLRTAAPKKNQAPGPALFTNLEKRLYNLILSCNIPYALFAQYQAGQGINYQLDAAFPALKLAVEADSTTYHSAPDKVAKDRKRDQELATQGWTVLRFTDDEIDQQPQAVIDTVISTLRKLASGGGSMAKSDNL